MYGLGLDLGWCESEREPKASVRGEITVKVFDYGGPEDVSLELFSTVALFLYTRARLCAQRAAKALL